MRPVLFLASPRGVAVLVSALVVSLLSAAFPARAQDGYQLTAKPLPPIDIVSATLVPTPADQVASTVTVITAADIERDQRRTVPDALQAVPGLNVVQTGGVGSQTSVFIRGTNSNHVKVFVDGIDVGDPSTPNGAFDFGHLFTGDIARIEVLRGPQSGLYGSDAIGGVISITTKRGEGPPNLTGTVEGGSFGTFNQTAGLSGSQGNFDYSFHVLHVRATSTPVTAQYLLAPGTQRHNDNYDNWTYSANVGSKVTDDLTVRLIARYTDAKRGITGMDYVNFVPPAAEPLQSRQTNHNLYTRAEALWLPFGDGFKNVFGVSYTNLRSFFVNPNPDSGFTTPVVTPPTTNTGQRRKIDWRGEAKVAPGQIVVFGLEHQKDQMYTDSTGITDAAFNFTVIPTSASVQNKAGFIELQSEIGKLFYLAANIRRDDHESFGGHNTWRVAPAFIIPVTDTKLKASYGTGFKAPSLNQLYASFPPFFLANPRLRPEVSVGYDTGFEQPLWNGRVSFGATYFHNNITDLINAVVIDPANFVSSLENVQKVKTQGWETFAAASVTDRLKLRTDYTYTRVRDLVTGLDLLRRPREKTSVTAIWLPVDQLSLSATLLHFSNWLDLDQQTLRNVPQRGFTVVNFAANYTVDQHVTVFGRIDNAFNEKYENPRGFLRPGFGIFGGVRVAINR